MDDKSILRAIVDDFALCPFCGYDKQYIYEDSVDIRGVPLFCCERVGVSAHISCRCGARLYSQTIVDATNKARALEQLIEHFRDRWGERHVPYLRETN